MMTSIGSVTCSSAFDVAQKVHTSLIMIGGAVRTEEAATVLRFPRSSASRMTRHAAEDQAIKKGGAGERDRLHPRLSIFPTGSGGKLCGKLMFGASQLWGKIGTAFL